MALKLITPNDNIDIAVKEGSFGNQSLKPYGAKICTTQGKYLRVFEDVDSIMLVLTPKEK